VRNELLTLLAAQLSAPMARIVFALLLVPMRADGTDLILILSLSEVLSTFLTFGRNYLLVSGFSHHLTTKWLDIVLLVPLAVGANFLLATAEQREFYSGVIVMTLAISTMTMGNAYFLKARKLALVLPLNVVVYVLAAFATSYSEMHALVAFVAWIAFESRLPCEVTVARGRALPVIATLLAFASQRIDVQVSAGGSPGFLRDVFQLNTLFMPLALLVRLVGNTALLRGRPLLNDTQIAKVLVVAIGLAYVAFLYGAGLVLKNSTIVNNILVLGLTAILSVLTITYRESIAMRSRSGNFMPLFLLSVVGIAPAVIYMVATGFTGPQSPMMFLLAMYLAPRVLMLVYGRVFLRTESR
jgi:hypothetical protein